ncbi:MAG: pyruvate dehydrogenase (acetyl-transferring), homodimeric type, partial [Porticoccus sp.]|nr:pyruvate dehydrogenase (acetyl-transferring), homodimeric type [Porticoccus sp.]
MMNSLTDEELQLIKRGGQDPKKVFAAFKKASETTDQPTVILVKTVKGDGMGPAAQGRNNAHQKKDLNAEERLACARAYGIPLDNDAIARAEFYRPPEDSDEMRYLQSHRQQLGGYLPERKIECPVLTAPALSLFQSALDGSGERAASTTMAMVRMLAQLMKEDTLGNYVVPIVPDEARTFGMEGMFRQLGIYSSAGQKYVPQDHEQIMYYKEDKKGQILEEGISEAGAMSAWMALATSYSTNHFPMVPVYIYYSMFGFQRIGDLAWAAGDMQARGFLIGATAGRTTLNGEGLQHQDGHSHLLANTIPNCRTYDPAYGYEVVTIVQDGLRVMFEEQENCFYYLTTMNENYLQPAMPDNVEEGIIKGMYLFEEGDESELKVQLMGAGSILNEVREAAVILKEKYNISADIWSLTSVNQLARDGQAADRWNLLHPDQDEKVPYITEQLTGRQGPVVVATDYVKTYTEQLRAYIPASYRALGTDGFGRSDSREQLRHFFEVNRYFVALSALKSLADEGKIDVSVVTQALVDFDLDPEKVNPLYC